ncbi:MAG: hypothetical protein Q4D51_00270 [Eubacteriales bacterium]|nr:hypothetical protein [Eubacteriales bacterium]
MSMSGFHYDLDSMFPKEPDFYANEELCMKDYEYMKRLYPKEERLISSVLEDYMDQFEYEGSPMYAQYPDAVTIYRIASEIWKKMSWKDDDKDKEKMKDMIQVMVCQEMYVRRRRHDHFCRKFKHMNPVR